MLDKITIFISENAKSGMCNWLDKSTATTPTVLATKKAKTAKDIFDRKPLLPPHYDFYE